MAGGNWSGTGTITDPWLIEDELDFLAIGNNSYPVYITVYFTIVNDLDLSYHMEALGRYGVKIDGGGIQIEGNGHTLSIHRVTNLGNTYYTIFGLSILNIRLLVQNLNFRLTWIPDIENDTIEITDNSGMVRIANNYSTYTNSVFEKTFFANCSIYIMWRTIQRPYFKEYNASIGGLFERRVNVAYTKFEFDIDIRATWYATRDGLSSHTNRFDFMPMLGKSYRCLIDINFRQYYTQWENHAYRNDRAKACVIQGTLEECIINYNLEFNLIHDFTHWALNPDTGEMDGWPENWGPYESFNQDYWIGLYDTEYTSGPQWENQLVNSYVRGNIKTKAIAIIRNTETPGTSTIPLSLYNILNVKNVMRSRHGEVINKIVQAYICINYETTPFWGTTFHNVIQNYMLNTDLIDDNTVETLNGNVPAIEASWFTDEQMKDINTFLLNNYDFINVWGIDQAINDGYPYLLWYSYNIKSSLFVQGPNGKINIPYVIGDITSKGLKFINGEYIGVIKLVDINSPNALPIRIMTQQGIKALSK